MKKLYIFLFFIFFTVTSISQSSVFDERIIDSLTQILKKMDDSPTKVEIYQKICNQKLSGAYISEAALNDCEIINSKIFQLSKALNYKTGIGFHYLNFAKIYTEKVYPDNPLILEYTTKAQQIFLQERKKLLYYETFAFLNENDIYMNKFDNAKKNILKYLQSKDLDNNLRMTFCSQMSKIYYREKSFYIALSYLNKALSYIGQNNDKRQLLSIYDGLANINSHFSRVDKVNYYMGLYYEIAKNDPFYLSYYYRMKSQTLQDIKKYDEALKLCLKNDVYYKTIDYYQSNSLYIYNKFELVRNYECLKKHDKAIMIMEGLLKESKLNDYDKFIISYPLLALLYNKVGAYQKANFYINQALKNIKLEESPSQKAYIFKNKSIIAKSTYDYITALEYSDKSAVLDKEYFIKKEKENALGSLNNIEDIEKENRIKRLKIATLEKTVQIDRQKNFLILILLGLAVAITSIMVYRKLYGSIKKRNRIIEMRNYELLSSQNIIQKALQEKEVLVKEIHHRVKNNLQLVMSLLSMQLRHNKEVDIANFVKTSQSRISSIALLYEQLYQQKSEGAVNFKEYVTVLSSAIVATYSDLHDQVSLDIEIPTIYFDLETATPLGLIISEFINNSFKHAFPNGQKGIIFLKMNILQGGKHELSISDNGVGLAKGYLDKNTLGIQLVNSLVAQIKGVIAIQNNVGVSYSIQF